MSAKVAERPPAPEAEQPGRIEVGYSAPGEVAKAFIRSRAFVKGIRGPVGSGKSAAACIDLFANACEQETFAGVRSARYAAVRNTYGELKTTTVKTWQDWFPAEFAPVKHDAPIECHINGRVNNFRHPVTGEVSSFDLDVEILFMALDRPQHVRKLRSLEITRAWLNEAKELPIAVLEVLKQRVGRYPAKRRGGVRHPGVSMDTNSPDDDHWWYRLAELERPSNHEFFVQPPALFKIGTRYYPNPAAENVHNQPLGFQYYLNQIPGSRQSVIDADILNKYASSSDGKPVYPEFDEHAHVSPHPLEAMRGIPLWIGVDAGLTPAAVIGQFTPDGQLRLLAEVTSTYMGMKQFCRDCLQPFMLAKYPGIPHYTVYDPAADTPDGGDIESSPAIQLEAHGFHGEPAPTNDYQPRRDALADFMLRRTSRGAGLLIDPGLRMVRKGLAGSYKYRRVQVTGEERYEDKPLKNEYSHPVEATQYIALKLLAGYGQRRIMAQPVAEAPVSAAGWT